MQQAHCTLFAKHRVLAGLQFLAKQTASSSICDQNHAFTERVRHRGHCHALSGRDISVTCCPSVGLGHSRLQQPLFLACYFREVLHAIHVIKYLSTLCTWQWRGRQDPWGNCEHLPLIFIPQWLNALKFSSKHSYKSEHHRRNIKGQR